MTWSQNVLINPNFDEGSHLELDENGHPIQQVEVGDGWIAWYSERDVRPEYKVDDRDPARRILSPPNCQHWFNSYAKHNAGIYQKIEDLTPGSKLRASAMVQTFSANHDDFSQSKGRYRFWIGIDPYGGTDWQSDDVVWSEESQPYDEFAKIAVEASAMSNRATLFIRGAAEWALKHNDAYVEDCVFQFDDLGNGGGGEPGEIDYNLIINATSRVTTYRVLMSLADGLIVMANFLKGSAQELTQQQRQGPPQGAPPGAP